ncbi:MAG TPA: hypothetical protein DIT55_07140, partial [Spirochaetaceae bacterium]|nr:hypothetical protein [Spirochaetaceae bacterium]
MIIEFTFQELLVFLLCVVGIVAGIIAIPFLLNMKKISENLKDTTNKLKVSFPAILQEVEHVTDSARGSLTLASDVLGKMGSGIHETVADYKKDSTGYFHLFEELMQLVYGSLTSG